MTTFMVQLSDMHIREPGRVAYGRINTAPYLRAAVDSIMKLKQLPEAVVLTGDLTDFGRAAEYAHLAELLAPLTMPLYLLPGNHDDRDQMRLSFPAHTYMGVEGFVQYSVAIGGLRLLALDTADAGFSAGRLCPVRLAWLARQLEQHRDDAVVIALHHPPFETLIGHMDAIGLLEGAPELEALVRRYPNVERVMSGHLHRTIYRRFGGTVASTCPSPAHQVALDLEPAAPSNWVLEPPGFHVHAWTAAGQLVTHAAASGVFEGPYPFHENGALID